MHANPRLTHLLELADKGPALRAALAEEVAELLADWPPDCPADMRGTFEILLARAARDIDADTRARLRVRLYAHPALMARVLPREGQDRGLVDAARGGGDVTGRMGDILGLPRDRVRAILADPTGHALAIACKGAGLGRAAFSTLALLAEPAADVASCYARLDVYDAVPATDAVHQLRDWCSGLSHAAE